MSKPRLTRERRSEIIRSATLWVADIVEDLPAVDGALYENLADSATEEGRLEAALAKETVIRISDSIRRRYRG